jgi:hypothetical protein
VLRPFTLIRVPVAEDILLEEQFAQKKMSRKTFSQLLQYLKPYEKLILLNLVLTVLAVASQLLGPN